MKRIFGLAVALFLLGSTSTFGNGNPLEVKHLYTNVVLLHNDKQEIVVHGVKGQEITILIRTKELPYQGEVGTELWIKVKSSYNGRRAKNKKHRLMFGADGYREHIVLRHKDKKNGREQEFQLNIDIRILKPGSKPDLNA